MPVDPTAILGIIFGTLLVAFVFGRITGIIKQAMKQRHERKYMSQDKEEILQEFERYRRKTERRLQHLEAIVTEEEEEPSVSAEQTAEAQRGYSDSGRSSAISSDNPEKQARGREIEDHLHSGEESSPDHKDRQRSAGNLNNMLKS